MRHGLDPESCFCESERGREWLAYQSELTAIREAAVDAERAVRSAIAAQHGELLFGLCAATLRSSAVWYVTLPLELVVLALLRGEISRLRDYVVCHELGAPPLLRSVFARWAEQGLAFPQRRLPGSYGAS